MSKEDELIDFLNKNIFDPILCCPHAHKNIEAGVHRTIESFRNQDARGMIDHFWKSIRGTMEVLFFPACLNSMDSSVLKIFWKRFVFTLMKNG